MERRYCLNCMSPIQTGQSCPSCGLAEGTYVPAAHHLPPGTVVGGGRYLVGRVLGEGGFGITYIGCDLRLELRVAIKEYYPTDRVSRASARSLSVEKHSGSLGESFEAGRERFLREARVMARMDKLPQIVGVRDFFQENNTAYIVMEYVDGTTLKELVAQKGGKISASELLPMVEPLFPAMSAMHAQDLIHRDISPDNIMLEKGGVRLLDFGCAREAAQGSKTMTIMLKHGYAPIEQYQHKGQGPWTDVYSLAATLYYCLTGTTPPQSLDRICDEELIPPRQLGADLTPAQERAILRGMGVRRSQRYGTVAEFHAALYQGAEIPPAPEPVMRGDLTVALEPELIPVIPEPEPAAAEPEPGPVMPGDLTVALEPEPVMAEPQPGPVMPGDLTVALEPEPVMPKTGPRTAPTPVEPDRFAPQPVYPDLADPPIKGQQEQKAGRQWLGVVFGIVAVVLLALLLWRLLSGGTQVGDEPPEGSAAVEDTAEPSAEPTEPEPENVVASGEAGPSVTWTLSDTGMLTISGSGEMYDFVYEDLPWAERGPEITGVVVESGVTKISTNAFAICPNLTSITLPEGVTEISINAFVNCTSLTSITLPKGVTKIGNNAFYGCTSLTSVTLPEGVTSIGDSAFWECTSLTSITLPESVTELRNNAFYKCASLTSMTLPKGVTGIGDYAFEECTSLTSITLPKSVTKIGDHTFHKCTSLTSVTLPEGVTRIGECAFASCTSLTSMTLPKGVTEIGKHAFYECIGLTSIILPKDVTEIGDHTFHKCTNLTNVTLPEGVAEISDYAFAECTGLTSMMLPKGVTSIGEGAFANCTGLASVILPEGVAEIGDYAFWECTSLTSITLPESVTSIGGSAFVNCTGLTSITLPEGVTKISNSALYGCASLTNVTLRNGVTEIDDLAFYGCTSLTDVYYGGTEAQWRNIKFGNYNDDLLNTVIHYNS